MPRGAQPKVAERENRMTYAAIRLFLENGYERTTTAAIAQAAGMSPSAFFAVFANKEALLLKLTKWMYEKQFAVTHELLGKDYDPVMFYAVEPAIQLYIAEKTEGLRELYVSLYSYAATANYIHQVVTDKLVELFGKEHPGYTRQDFYELELATSGMLRSFMARKCDQSFTMEQKLRRFLSCGMTIYGVDQEKQQEVIDQVLKMDLKSVADQLLAQAMAQSQEEFQEAELLSPVGGPYDTLEEVIGIRPSPCSLKEYGVSYRQVDLLPDGGFDYDGIRAAINEKTRLITIQRSKGYATRPSYSVEEIGKLIAFCKECKPDVLCMVDNCYGEFVETREPTNVGADMVVGSLIKNLGGGLAPTGGYICGRKSCIERCAYRLSAPGLGREVGANLGLLTSFYQGLFLAPTVVSSAVRGAVFAAGCYEKLGFRVVPGSGETRRDIIQAVELGSREAMVAFCKGIQSAAPVDSYVTPEPWAMPGYESEVIMAAGAFVQGASIELSADGPIRPPYAVYFQGGLTWFHAKLGILMSIQKLLDAGIIEM